MTEGNKVNKGNMKSWKTTVGGVGSILSGIALILGGVVKGDYSHVPEGLGLIMGGFGLVFARDNNVTSEQAGAK